MWLIDKKQKGSVERPTFSQFTRLFPVADKVPGLPERVILEVKIADFRPDDATGAKLSTEILPTTFGWREEPSRVAL